MLACIVFALPLQRMRYLFTIVLGLVAIGLNLQPIWAAQATMESTTSFDAASDKKQGRFWARLKALPQKALHRLSEAGQALKRFFQSDQELIRLLIIILIVALIVSLVVWLLPWPLDVIIMVLALVVALVFLLRYLS